VDLGAEMMVTLMAVPSLRIIPVPVDTCCIAYAVSCPIGSDDGRGSPDSFYFSTTRPLLGVFLLFSMDSSNNSLCLFTFAAIQRLQAVLW
jgi:hypothetical protein